MKKIVLLLNIVLLTTLIVTVYSQNNNSTNLPQASPQNLIKTDTERLSTLETKLEVMNDYNSQILDNIYWALGAVTTVIFIVLGLGYYNNKRNVEELKQELKTSLRREILSELSQSAREEIEKIKSNELKDLREMKYNFVKMEVENWKTKEVHPNVLSTSLNLLKIAQETDSKYDI